MLFYLLYPLRNAIAGFNVFRYITFRTAWAAITAPGLGRLPRL